MFSILELLAMGICRQRRWARGTHDKVDLDCRETKAIHCPTRVSAQRRHQNHAQQASSPRTDCSWSCFVSHWLWLTHSFAREQKEHHKPLGVKREVAYHHQNQSKEELHLHDDVRNRTDATTTLSPSSQNRFDGYASRGVVQHGSYQLRSVSLEQ